MRSTRSSTPPRRSSFSSNTKRVQHKDEIKAKKRDLRIKMLAKLKAHPPATTKMLSDQTTTTLFQQSHWQNAKSILSFASLPHEYDTTDLINEAFNTNKRLFLPRVIDYQLGIMEFFEIFSHPDELEISSYRIYEPTPFLPSSTTPRPNLLTTPNCVESLDFILCPFVLVDTQCRRVGYGGGFYDRFLQRVQIKRQELGLPDVPVIGIGLDSQLCTDFSLPIDEFDITLDGVITGDRFFGPIFGDIQQQSKMEQDTHDEIIFINSNQ